MAADVRAVFERCLKDLEQGTSPLLTLTWHEQLSQATGSSVTATWLLMFFAYPAWRAGKPVERVVESLCRLGRSR